MRQRIHVCLVFQVFHVGTPVRAVQAYTEALQCNALCSQFQKRTGLRIAAVRAGFGGALFKAAHLHRDANALQGVHGGIDGAIAYAL